MQFNNKKYIQIPGVHGGHSKNLTMHKYADHFKFDSCKDLALTI